jgi:hypothetical protein
MNEVIRYYGAVAIISPQTGDIGLAASVAGYIQPPTPHDVAQVAWDSAGVTSGSTRSDPIVDCSLQSLLHIRADRPQDSCPCQ